MSERADQLAQLAGKRFKREDGTPDLTEAEQQLLQATVNGTVCDLARENDQLLSGDSEAGCWDAWGPHRTVRAEVLRWICVDREAREVVDARGIVLANAKVMGRLNLGGASIPFPFTLSRCAIPESFFLLSASLLVLNLGGCHTGMVAGDRLKSGNVFLREGFVARGEVRLAGAEIGGQLDCTDGRFECAEEAAITANGVRVQGDVYLTGRFIAHAEVRLGGGEIGGDFNCIAGRFENRGKTALSANRLTVRGDVELSDGFIARGEVSLIGAKIGGNLGCAKGEFAHPEGQALDFQSGNVNGALVMGVGFIASGDVDLTHSRIGYLVDAESAWPSQLLLTDCQYGAIFAGSPCDAKRRRKWLAAHDRTVQDRLRNASNFRFDPQPYRHLAGVLRRQGHESDADWIMITAANKAWWSTPVGPRLPSNFVRVRQMRESIPDLSRRRQRAWLRRRLIWHQARGLLADPFTLLRVLRWCGHLLLFILIGHGYLRWLPAIWLLVFFLLGWTLFSIYEDALQPAQPLAIRAQVAGDDWMDQYPTLRPFIYALDTLIPVMNLHQEEYWIPQPGWLRGYLWFHIAMGWILSTLFVVGLTGLVRHVSTGENSGRRG